MLVGAVLSVLAGLKWRSIRYSAAAIFVTPQVIHSVMQKHWLVVAVVLPLMLIAILVDVRRSRQPQEKSKP